VQRRILELLAPVVELSFYEQSFGFRLRKGSHDALRYLKSYWSNVTWIIRVNVEKHFSRINHKILLTKIYHYMDRPSLNLISKFCKVGYINRDNLTESCQAFEQISHTFILFPLLCNIYFHNFDQFIIENLIGVRPIKDVSPMVLDCQGKNGVSLYNSKLLKIFRIFKSFKQFYPNFNKLYYVRYIVNFMFGYIGDRLGANQVYFMVFNYISGILKFGLYSNESTIVYSIKYVRYLETMIRWEKNLKIFSSLNSYKTILFNEPHVTVSLENLYIKMILRKYSIRRLIYTKIARVVSFSSILKQDLHGIIKSFNCAVRDIVNYYSFISSRSKLWKIVDVFHKSCAAIIADKLNLKTASQAFKKFGRFLIFKNNSGKGVTRLDAWPYRLKTKKKFNVEDFKTNFGLLVKKIDNYLSHF
jgi:Type II intron maturase